MDNLDSLDRINLDSPEEPRNTVIKPVGPRRSVRQKRGPKSMRYVPDLDTYLDRILQHCNHTQAKVMCLAEYDPQLKPDYPDKYEDIWPDDDELIELRVDIPASPDDCMYIAADIGRRIREIDIKLTQPDAGLAMSEYDFGNWRNRTVSARFFLYRELAFIDAWTRAASFRLYRQMLSLGLADAEGVKPGFGLAAVMRDVEDIRRGLSKERAKRHKGIQGLKAAVSVLIKAAGLNPREVFSVPSSNEVEG